MPTRNVKVAAEKVAINAVMAGCRPEYFPVVVAAVRAFLQPKANAHSTTATLAGAAHAVIVNGPARTELDIVSGQACFGPGFRPTQLSAAPSDWSSATFAALCPAISIARASAGPFGTRFASARTRRPANGHPCTSNSVTPETKVS